MAFGNFLKTALPIAAGIFGSPALGAAVGGAMQFFGGRGQANAAEAAGARAAGASQQGYNYLASGPVGTDYVNRGAEALNLQAGLLGTGGDPAAAQEAYNNYLNSIGFQGQLKAGSQGVMAGAAGLGARGSGATLRALQENGMQLGRQSFNNYLAQLGGLSQQGLQAGGMVGQAAANAGANAAGFQYGAGMDAAGSRREAFDGLATAAGGIFEGVQGLLQRRGATSAPRKNVLALVK